MAATAEPYVFVSYSSDDRVDVEPIVENLRLRGVPIRWDLDLEAGQDWDETLARWRAAAAAIVVFWSARSVRSEQVIGEAHEGRLDKRLVPVRIDDVDLPKAFSTIHTVDGRAWVGDAFAVGLDSLADVLHRRLSGKGPGSYERTVSERELRPTTGSSAPPGPSSGPVTSETEGDGDVLAFRGGVRVPHSWWLDVRDRVYDVHADAAAIQLDGTWVATTADLGRPFRLAGGLRASAEVDLLIRSPGAVVFQRPADVEPIAVTRTPQEGPAALCLTVNGQRSLVAANLRTDAGDLHAQVVLEPGEAVRPGDPIFQDDSLVGLSTDHIQHQPSLAEVTLGVRSIRPFLDLIERIEGRSLSSDDELVDLAETAIEVAIDLDPLDQPEPELTGRFDSDLVRWDRPIVDHLGVAPYVRMLATVLAAEATPLPVSVGVFGAWGSGKTSFMQLLRQEIDALAAAEREHRDADPDRPHVYGAEIRQITFNAWHYADANLWASLAAHVFRELAEPDGSSGALALERADLVAHLDSFREERERLEGGAKAARKRAAALQGALTVSQAERTKLVGVLRTVAESAITTLASSEEWVEASADLQRRAEAQGLTAADPRALIEEVRAAGTRWRRLLAQLAGPKNRRILWVGLACVVVGGLAVAATRMLWPSLAALVTPLLVAAGAARQALATLDRRADQVERTLDRLALAATAGQRGAIAAAQAELDRATAEADALAAELAAAERAEADAKEALAALSAGRRLTSFVQGRHASDEYRSHLGVVSLVRRDFEDLVGLLRARLADHVADDRSASVERIVLYIDDLDRCPPDRVAEVLEAVHLLLAIDLFVVVVGVDPRWLVQSLARAHGALGGLGTESSAVTATPVEYLEKIFQIPFVLPRLHEVGLGALLDSFVEDRGDERGPNPADTPARPTADPDGVDLALVSLGLDDPTDPLDAPVIETGSVIDAPFTDEAESGPKVAPERLGLTAREVAFLKTLAPLVGTPRSVKRLANVYRLLRTTRNVGPSSAFLGTADQPGEFRVVGELLGIVAGFPQLFGELCWAPTTGDGPRALCDRPGFQPWSEFVDDLRPTWLPADPGTQTGRDGRWTNAVVGPLTDPDAWRSLHAALTSPSLAAARGDVAVEAYQRWVPWVARFSFQPSDREPATG